jgi:hypothetical protein
MKSQIQRESSMKKLKQHVLAYLYLPVQIALGLVLGGVALHVIHCVVRAVGLGH